MYDLPPEDREFLDAEFPGKWDLAEEYDKRGLIIRGYNSLPEGYAPPEVDLMILVPADYPTAQLDMFYFDPEVSRKDGLPINALSLESHFQKQWQRWSRHYEWCPGKDSIATHITNMRNVLQEEIKNS